MNDEKKAETKNGKVTSADDVKGMGGAQGPGKGRGPCTYRGFPLCLRRFFLCTVNYFFLCVRLLRGALFAFSASCARRLFHTMCHTARRPNA